MSTDHITGPKLMDIERLSLAELKAKSPADLLKMAEELEIENASTMRKGDMMFAILKETAEDGVEISGDGVLEVLQDGFGFLRSPEAILAERPTLGAQELRIRIVAEVMNERKEVAADLIGQLRDRFPEDPTLPRLEKWLAGDPPFDFDLIY
jgi:hypothetical protein